MFVKYETEVVSDGRHLDMLILLQYFTLNTVIDRLYILSNRRAFHFGSKPSLTN